MTMKVRACSEKMLSVLTMYSCNKNAIYGVRNYCKYFAVRNVLLTCSTDLMISISLSMYFLLLIPVAFEVAASTFSAKESKVDCNKEK
jgi:hypothetical protein